MSSNRCVRVNGAALVLAACGGGDAGGGDELRDVLNFANWPFYIDVDEETKRRPTLDQFTEETGIRVNYYEEINDNAEYFAKVQGPLSQGNGIDRDIFVFTDNSRFPGCSSARAGSRSSTRTRSPTSRTSSTRRRAPPSTRSASTHCRGRGA